WINGAPAGPDNQLRQVGGLTQIQGEVNAETGPLAPVSFLATLADATTTAQLWKQTSFTSASGDKVTLYYYKPTPGNQLMRPGLKFKVQGTPLEKLDFVSL